MNKPVIGKVYHNRCVLLDAEHLSQAGIAKNDQVTLRVSGDAIIIRKAHVVDTEQCEKVIMDCLVSFIRTMSPDQVTMIKHTMNLQTEG